MDGQSSGSRVTVCINRWLLTRTQKQALRETRKQFDQDIRLRAVNHSKSRKRLSLTFIKRERMALNCHRAPS